MQDKWNWLKVIVNIGTMQKKVIQEQYFKEPAHVSYGRMKNFMTKEEIMPKVRIFIW